MSIVSVGDAGDRGTTSGAGHETAAALWEEECEGVEDGGRKKKHDYGMRTYIRKNVCSRIAEKMRAFDSAMKKTRKKINIGTDVKEAKRGNRDKHTSSTNNGKIESLFEGFQNNGEKNSETTQLVMVRFTIASHCVVSVMPPDVICD